MGIGFAIFKGNDADIEEVANLVKQINAIYEELRKPYLPFHKSMTDADMLPLLRERFNDDSEQNKKLKNFLGLIDKYLYFGMGEGYELNVFADQDLIFNKPGENQWRYENSLDFGGYKYDPFDTEGWANLLANAFPRLSFFIVGDMSFMNDSCGYEWLVYKEGVCVTNEYNIFNVEDLEHDTIDSIINSVSELIYASIDEWQLGGEDEEQLKTAQAAKKEAEKKLEKIIKESSARNDEATEGNQE